MFHVKHFKSFTCDRVFFALDLRGEEALRGVAPLF